MPVSEQVFQNMRDAIKNSVWKKGEKIPSEIELSTMFDVNRLTVRTAMQRLIGMGLLETRVGDGTYVTEFSFGKYLQLASDFYLLPELIDKVCEFRYVIEIEALRLAVTHATEDDIKDLELACETFEKYKVLYLESQSEDVFKSLVNSDVDFHRKICEASKNDLFVYAFLMFQDLLAQYIGIVLKDRYTYWKRQKDMESHSDDLHRLVCTTLRKRDFDLCKKIYSDVIDYRVDLTM